MTTIVLRQNVVSDDVVYIADKNKVFKGGYTAILEYNTYLNQWCDKQHFRRFKSLNALEKYINKNYKDFVKECYSIYEFMA
jgi:hypothetical protein